MRPSAKTTGLRYWMESVLEECELVAADFSTDPVHDLRVSLRRCRSLADGLMAIDPDPNWKAMKKAGKRLFQRLGALRDVQVMMEWIEKLDPTPTSSVERALLPALPEPAEPSDTLSAAAPSTEPDATTQHDPAAQTLLQILNGREIEQKAEARA